MLLVQVQGQAQGHSRSRWRLAFLKLGDTWLFGNLVTFIFPSNYFTIGVTLNTKLDTLWFSQVCGPMKSLTKGYDTSPESWVPGAKPGVDFMLIASVLCLPSQFENCTFCRAEYSEILPFYAIWQKIGMSCKLSGKTKFSMASCNSNSWPLKAIYGGQWGQI